QAAAPHPAAMGVLSGVVRDSLLTGGPLPNAIVWIEGTPREARTNLNGLFRFDSIPAGTYQLTFSHPVFDAAGIAAPRWRIEVPAEGLEGVVLATPSAESRYGRACPGPRAPSTGYIVGVVQDAATDSALVGANVNAMWAEVAVSRTTGVTTNRRNVRAVTGAQGAFVLCGVPINSEVTVWAAIGPASTGLVTVDMAGRSLVARQFLIGVPPANPATVDSSRLTASLEGTVKNIDGSPVTEARVFVRGSRAVVRTSASGSFNMSGLPLGTQVVEVAAIGYAGGRQAVALKPGSPARIELVIAKSVQTLPTLETVGRAGGGADVSTFLQRAQRSQGHFLTEEDIHRRGAIQFEDILRTVPGLQVVPQGQGYRVISSRGIVNARGDCSPNYFVDGVHLPFDVSGGAEFPVQPYEIMAMEIYAGAAQTPAEFQRTANSCGAIVIWTKRGGGAPKR
ncbi:MAG TPA: carboxypeptidase regulatory-like domain-containing protein, partial [Gemmatimonadales bacterium]|nr:carboxypeptidase regulatory-like domain-containing protein [Gemmatimonadales bacterium]